MNKPFTHKAIALAIAASIPAGVAPVMAQEDMSFALEEVVVTAQKREQSLQDVPSTVNAIQGDNLTDLKLFNFSDLEQVTPGLDMRTIDGRAGSIALRGVDYNPNSAAAQAVDVYWNDITLGSNASGGVFQEMFDLGRVEILRGPQGTLQGRTSPAGAVAIHTAKPDMEEIEGYARTTFTNNSGNNSQFAASLPIVPGELSLRVAGVYNDNEIDEVQNILDGGVTDTNTRAGRITLAWEPSAILSTELVYQYLENDLQSYKTLTGVSSLTQGLPDLTGSDRKSISLQPDTYTGRFENVSLTVDWEIADHQVTFVSGYSEVSSVRDFDNAPGNSESGYDDLILPPAFGGNLTALFPQLGAAGSQLNSPQMMIDQNYASSQELRVASIDNEFWDYTVGLFYGNESGFFNRQLMQESSPAALAAVGGAAFFDSEVRAPFNIQSYGVFAHNMFQLTDHWSAQLGIRWQRQERTTEAAVFLLEDVVTPAATIPAETQLAVLIADALETGNSEKWTGSASLQYSFDEPDLVAYISAGTSYRPGGVTVAAANLNELTEFNEEDSWSLEMGFKSTWLDNRLRLNGALFHQNYSDYIGRAANITISTGQSISITHNGDANIQGLEADFELLLTKQWRVAGGASYVEAEYKDGAEIPCNGGAIPTGATAVSCDVGGLELGTQPRLSASISSDYSIPLDGFEGYVQGLYKFTGGRTDVDAPSGDLGGFGTFDVHVGIREGGGAWDLSLFARNLFDKEATDSMDPEIRTFDKNGSGYQTVKQVPQRLVGVSATYNF